MQEYDSLALEVNSEVVEAVLGRCSISLFAPKKEIHSLHWVLPGEDLVISLTCEVRGLRSDSRKDNNNKHNHNNSESPLTSCRTDGGTNNSENPLTSRRIDGGKNKTGTPSSF